MVEFHSEVKWVRRVASQGVRSPPFFRQNRCDCKGGRIHTTDSFTKRELCSINGRYCSHSSYCVLQSAAHSASEIRKPADHTVGLHPIDAARRAHKVIACKRALPHRFVCACWGRVLVGSGPANSRQRLRNQRNVSRVPDSLRIMKLAKLAPPTGRLQSALDNRQLHTALDDAR